MAREKKKREEREKKKKEKVKKEKVKKAKKEKGRRSGGGKYARDQRTERHLLASTQLHIIVVHGSRELFF
jgi:hypothetical protein